MSSLQDIYKLPGKQKGTRLRVGIHEKLTTKMERGKSENSGNSFTDITFTNDDGLFFKDRVWDPNGKTFKKKDETQQEADAREIQSKERLLGNLLKAIVPFEEVIKANKPASTYNENAETITNLVNKFGEKTPVNLKLVFDSKGQWPKLPTWDTIWIEQHIPGKPTTLAYDKWETENVTTQKFDTLESNDLVINDQMDYDIV